MMVVTIVAKNAMKIAAVGVAKKSQIGPTETDQVAGISIIVIVVVMTKTGTIHVTVVIEVFDMKRIRRVMVRMIHGTIGMVVVATIVTETMVGIIVTIVNTGKIVKEMIATVEFTQVNSLKQIVIAYTNVLYSFR